jgi:hypothetical protein
MKCKMFYCVAKALGPERTREELIPFINGKGVVCGVDDL